MSADIVYPESALYKTAGIAVWRPKPNGKGIQFMMPLDKTSNSLSFFGGDKHENDKTCIDTAVRQFHQQTANKLDDDTLSQIRQMLMRDKDRSVFWKAEWKSILYYYQMSYDYDIVKDYKTIKQWNADIKSIHWVDFDKIYRSVFISGNPVKLSKNNKYALISFVVGMFLHEQNRKYMFDLHIKYGGDMNQLKACNGGSIRSTVKVFTKIPKVIRLDVLSPITCNVLYQKWVESEIDKIEDYQLLISLVASICPEIGRNFMLYYTDNKCFKTSKTQYLIDTIPAFNELIKKLALKKSNNYFVTQINIIPTFIVSDNFKGISLSFKKNDVLWKDIRSNNDDEKGFGAAVYDKASDWAQAWFGGNADNQDSNEAEGSDGQWKWQFMNDKNKFEDFKSKNSKLLEATFLCGCSFTNFKRKNVNYQANFKTMCQKNLNTSNIRNIRRVPVSVKGDKSNDKSNDNNNNYNVATLQYYKWQYKDNGTWTDYDREISKQLNTFKSNCNNNNNSGYGYNWYGIYDKRYTYSTNIKNKNNSLSYNYLIDIHHMKQKNVSTKKERDIRQIPVYDQNNNYNNYNNFGLFQFKWQFKDDGYKKWTDFDSSVSQFIETQYTMNSFAMPFNVNTNSKSYKIHFKTMQQQCLTSGKFRSIRRQQINFNNMNIQCNTPIKHVWEWLDDDHRYKKYDKFTSNNIENACNSGIKKYFFVSTKNNNSYEINFNSMSQYNIQSGKQRKVRKVVIAPKWKGAGPDPKQWKGPMSNNKNRRTFDKKIMDLYCVVGDMTAKEVKKSGKLIRGSLGPFGSGLYFYDNISQTKQMAKNRSGSNKGYVIKAKVFIGKQYDVSNMDDKEFDFITLQKNGYDSVKRSLGFGNEYIVYNMDQVCIVKTDKY